MWTADRYFLLIRSRYDKCFICELSNFWKRELNRDRDTINDPLVWLVVPKRLARTVEAQGKLRRWKQPVKPNYERSGRKEVLFSGAKSPPPRSTMRCTYGENDFLIPSANPPNNRSQRPTSTCQGFLFTLLLGVGVFGVSTGVTRFFFPRGLSGQQGSSKPETNLLSGDEGRWKTWTDCATTIAGDPVLEGADLVSYFSLTDGQAAMYGTEQHEASYHGYTFWFVSEENKALFEVRQATGVR